LKFAETELPGVIVVQPDVHGDDRGFFLETYHAKKYADGGIEATFVQDNQSNTAPALSKKDAEASTLAELTDRLPVYEA
jgi:dTDP-4-dehydrorhamnose 3,5-epimerase